MGKTPAPARKAELDQQDPSMVGLVESLQRSAGNAAVGQLLGRGATPTAQSSAGDPLPPRARAAGERRLGADLGDVRVHTDAGAGTYAESLGAEAVTVGKDVFMSARPGGLETSSGRKTLMHELAHAVQAEGRRESVKAVSSPAGAPEREALAIGEGGFYGAISPPTQIAPASVAHRKVPVEEEEEDEVTILDEDEDEVKVEDEDVVLADARKHNKPKTALEAEFEEKVVQQLLTAFDMTVLEDWKAAHKRLSDVATYLNTIAGTYDATDPVIAERLNSVRNYVGIVMSQVAPKAKLAMWDATEVQDAIKQAVEAATDLHGAIS